jgi:hypothetical protein
VTWSDILNFLGAERYTQHSICLSNDPIALILYTGSDLTTFFSYFVIGGTLLIKQAKGIAFSPAALSLFGAFIFLCGLSHLTMVLTLYEGVYYLDIMVRALMAAVSAVTAVFVVLEVYGFRADPERG